MHKLVADSKARGLKVVFEIVELVSLPLLAAATVPDARVRACGVAQCGISIVGARARAPRI